MGCAKRIAFSPTGQLYKIDCNQKLYLFKEKWTLIPSPAAHWLTIDSQGAPWIVANTTVHKYESG